MYAETPYNLEGAQYTLYSPIFLQKKLLYLPGYLLENSYKILRFLSKVVMTPTKGLVTNYGEGGLQNGRGGGGHVKFYPYEKGGRNKF